MDRTRARLLALICTLALGAGLAACGTTDDVEQLQKDAEQSGDELRKEADDVQKSVEKGDPSQIDKEARDLQKKGQQEGDQLRKKGEQIEKDAREQTPGY